MSKKVVKLTEAKLNAIVKRVIEENSVIEEVELKRKPVSPSRDEDMFNAGASGDYSSYKEFSSTYEKKEKERSQKSRDFKERLKQ